MDLGRARGRAAATTGTVEVFFLLKMRIELLCRTQLMIEEEERIGQLEQREQSMRQLESDIVDVNTIFKVLTCFLRPFSK